MAHPEVHFTMHHNDNLVFPENRRQRIVSPRKKYNERLVPVEENTSISKLVDLY